LTRVRFNTVIAFYKIYSSVFRKFYIARLSKLFTAVKRS